MPVPPPFSCVVPRRTDGGRGSLSAPIVSDALVFSPKCLGECPKRNRGRGSRTLRRMKTRYPTDLTDAEWGCIEPHLPAAKERGRPRIHSPRQILDAVFYVLRSGCAWRLLPRDFPPWKTSTTTSASGVLTASSSGSTPHCVSGCGPACVGTLNRAQASSIRSRPRQPESVAKHEATTEARRCAAVSAICWWIQRAWY